MKKILKSRVFLVMVTAILCTKITAYATIRILASEVTYNNTTVDRALDTLYTKAKPDYNGNTEITPTTIEQTLETNDKILRSDIIIGAIPNSYKDLTTSTTVDASKLLKNETAYNNLGELITGNIDTECVNGSFIPSNGYKVSSFNPSFFIIYGTGTDNKRWYNIYDKNWNASNYYEFSSSLVGVKQTALTSYYTVNNGLYLKDWGSNSNTTYFIVCK